MTNEAKEGNLDAGHPFQRQMCSSSRFFFRLFLAVEFFDSVDGGSVVVSDMIVEFFCEVLKCRWKLELVEVGEVDACVQENRLQYTHK